LDLSKAKTILILAFLALNLFLGYRLWFTPQLLQAGQSLTGDEADQARELLQAAGFEVAAAVPRQIPRLSLLHVSREEINHSKWVRSFFGEWIAGEKDGEGNMRYQNGDTILTVTPNGQVIYRSGSGPTAPAGEDPRYLADRFLREKDLWPDDLKYDYMVPRDPQGVVRHRYVQTYQGFPLFFCVVETAVRDGRITEMTAYRVAPLGFSGRDIQVISALEAVEMFLEQKPYFPEQKITDISLGYFSEDYNAQRWEIAPVWRMAGATGHTVYINAFTGEVETDRR
jgi:hypothetical protein